MKRYVMTAVWPLLLCAAQAGAELRVIADIGGSDASVFYEAINRQEGSSTPPRLRRLCRRRERRWRCP